MTEQPKRDRLASLTAWICAAGILAAGGVMIYASHHRIDPARVASADLPQACPAPKVGEQLHITVTYSDGLLNLTCRTVHTALPLKRNPR